MKISQAYLLSVSLLLGACGGATGNTMGADDSPAGAGSANAQAGAAAGGVGNTGGGLGGAPGRTSGGNGATPSGGASSSTAGQGASSTAGQGAGGTPSSAGGAGKTGSGGALSNTGTGPSPSCKAWPAAMGSPQKLQKTVSVSADYDGKLQRFVSDGLGDGAQGENQLPLFELADGATLENVIIGAPAADGIHCLGSCTLKNVWWEDVGEDAATLKGSNSSQVMKIDCGGAKMASDKVFQHNGPGTMSISNFYVATFGKLYRSCGNCSKQYARHVLMSGIRAEGGSVLAGVNANYDDTATFSNIQSSTGVTICERYTGNSSGAEPPKLGAGADGKVCIYAPSDIHSL